jgi:hypothetical protein
VALLTNWNGDWHVLGRLSSQTQVYPTGSIDNDAISSVANIDATKVQTSNRALLEQESATTAFNERRVIHIVRGANAVIAEVFAGSVVANIGAATVTLDLLVNGVSVLAAPLIIDSTHVAYQIVPGILSTSTLLLNDVVEMDVTAVAGGGTLATGLFAEARISEDGA